MAALQFNTTNYARAKKGAATIIITSNTANQTLIPAVNNYYTDIYAILLTNDSSTNTMVYMSDGTQSYPLFSPALATEGFSFPVEGCIPASNANIAWTANTAASVANVHISAFYVLNNI